MKAQIYDLIYIFIEKVYINQGNRLKSLYRHEQVHSVVYWGVVSLYTNNL